MLADKAHMVLTWLLYLLLACVSGILSSLCLIRGRHIKKSLRNYTRILGTVKRQAKGISATVEWKSRGENCVMAPPGLIMFRKKSTIKLLVDRDYTARAIVDHWTNNGNIWFAGFATLALTTITLLTASIISLFS